MPGTSGPRVQPKVSSLRLVHCCACCGVHRSTLGGMSSTLRLVPTLTIYRLRVCAMLDVLLEHSPADAGAFCSEEG